MSQKEAVASALIGLARVSKHRRDGTCHYGGVEVSIAQALCKLTAPIILGFTAVEFSTVIFSNIPSCRYS